MSFVCCFWVLGFSEIASSRRDPLYAPRTSWQKLGKNWICTVRAATHCARRELLSRKLGIFGFVQFAPRSLVRAANCLAESLEFLNSLSSRRELLWRREPCFRAFFLNFERP